MKRSNLLLVLLSFLLLAGLFVTDRLLALQYLKTDLSDPYKNFQYLPVKPFGALKINGGNGYSIQVLQGKNYTVRVRNSRKSFFKMQYKNDTLDIGFSVASQQYQAPEDCTVGLIITMPRLAYLQLSGTNNIVGPFMQDSLTIQQDKNTITRLNGLHVNHLNLYATGFSSFDCRIKNRVKQLGVNLTDNASIHLREISLQQFHPVVKDSATVVFYPQSLEGLMHPLPAFVDSLLLKH